MPTALSPQLLSAANAVLQQRNRDFLHERYANPYLWRPDNINRRAR